jgi:hypothetical protein
MSDVTLMTSDERRAAIQALDDIDTRMLLRLIEARHPAVVDAALLEHARLAGRAECAR